MSDKKEYEYFKQCYRCLGNIYGNAIVTEVEGEKVWILDNEWFKEACAIVEETDSELIRRKCECDT